MLLTFIIGYLGQNHDQQAVPWIWVAYISLALSGNLALAIIAMRLAREKKRLNEQQSHLLNHKAKIEQELHKNLATADERIAALEKAKDALQAQQNDLLAESHSQAEKIEAINRTNPAFQRVVYNVGFIGAAGSGKTALILNLVDPIFLEFNRTMPTSSSESYDRTVVVQQHPRDYRRQQHVFRFREWGGEHLVKSQSDMLHLSQPSARVEKENLLELDGVHGIVFVVDLGWLSDDTQPDARSNAGHIFHEGRITDQQTKYFNVNVIKFLLNDKVLTYCRTVILFINKSDLIEKYPMEAVENTAKEHYRDLILALRAHFSDLTVIVGSANTGVGLHRLYATLVGRILAHLHGVDNIGLGNKYTHSSERTTVDDPITDVGTRPADVADASAAGRARGAWRSRRRDSDPVYRNRNSSQRIRRSAVDSEVVDPLALNGNEPDDPIS